MEQLRFRVPSHLPATGSRTSPHLRLVGSLKDERPGALGADMFAAQLLAVATHADRAAFAALFAHFAPRIKAYLMRSGASAAVAEELAQDAMLAVWRKAGYFDPRKAQASTWIFTIARNLRIDALRRENRPEPLPETPGQEPATDADAEDLVMAAQQEQRLRRAIATLPRDQAEVVSLSFFADKPHVEIGRDLGIPLGTVKSRLRLAMSRLRAALGTTP